MTFISHRPPDFAGHGFSSPFTAPPGLSLPPSLCIPCFPIHSVPAGRCIIPGAIKAVLQLPRERLSAPGPALLLTAPAQAAPDGESLISGSHRQFPSFCLGSLASTMAPAKPAVFQPQGCCGFPVWLFLKGIWGVLGPFGVPGAVCQRCSVLVNSRIWALGQALKSRCFTRKNLDAHPKQI